MEVNQSVYSLVNSNAPLKSSNFVKTAFFAFGVSSILGWNATLTALDYFDLQFAGFEVGFKFPVPLFISNCLTGFLLPKLSLYMSSTFRMAWSLIFVCIILIFMPLIANRLPDENGFYITMGLIFFLGMFNSFQQNSAIGLASQMGGEYIGIFWLGTGFSGTIICVFRMICLLLLKDDPGQNCFVYFCVAATWNIFSIFLFFQLVKTPHYLEIIKTQLLQERNPETLSNSDVKDYSAVSDTNYSESGKPQKKSINNMNIFQIVLYVHKITFPVSIFITLIYIQTFMMFPGISLSKGFPDDWITWGPTLLIFTFNIGDTIGKFMGGYRRLYNQTSLICIVLLRFGFYVSFYMIVKGDIEPYWFAFTNLLFFAITNGFCTAGFMQIGPEKVEDKMKEKVGFVQGFSLVFGIMLGTFLALPLQWILSA